MSLLSFSRGHTGPGTTRPTESAQLSNASAATPCPMHDHIPGFLVHGGRCPSDGRPLGDEPRPELASGEHPTVRVRGTAGNRTLRGPATARNRLGSGRPSAPQHHYRLERLAAATKQETDGRGRLRSPNMTMHTRAIRLEPDVASRDASLPAVVRRRGQVRFRLVAGAFVGHRPLRHSPHPRSLHPTSRIPTP